MSAPRWLGDSAQWGLTPRRFAALAAELSDHESCLREDPLHGAARAERLQASVAQPRTRRRLTAAHLADQVYATLHRRPSREQWRELGWLLAWFALIIASDLLAVPASAELSQFLYVRPDPSNALLMPDITAAWGAWLMQGVARAGFFATFAYSIWRAWQSGWGVALARLLQLKLLHTVLVVAAGLAIGASVERFSWGGFDGLEYPGLLPGWLTAPVISALLLASGVAVWLIKWRAWAWGFALVLLAGFLYPGGPTQAQKYRVVQPYIRGNLVELSNGSVIRKSEYRPEAREYFGVSIVREIPLTPQVVEEWYNSHRPKYLYHFLARAVDFERNTLTYEADRPVPLAGHVRDWVDPVSRAAGYRPYDWLKSGDRDVTPIGPRTLLGPLAAPGAGLAWLAAPIPLLGFVGLLSLLLLMGRRGPVDALLYALLVGLALLTTVMPFMVGQPASQIAQFNAMGVVHSPFPGFEGLLLVSWQELVSPHGGGLGIGLMGFTLIIGLLLSAALPWVLTALFLKPREGDDPDSGPLVEAEA